MLQSFRIKNIFAFMDLWGKIFYLRSGKTMMIRALANECDAIVLDISPLNIEGKILNLI